MPNNLTGIVFALLSFAVTFAIARLLAKWWRRRRSRTQALEELRNQSRQVRRARERGKR